MRNIIAIVATVGLIASSALADEASGPLAPGKPVGVKQAQTFHDDTTWIILGVALAAGAIALIVDGSAYGGTGANVVASSAAASSGGGTTTTTTPTTTGAATTTTTTTTS